MSGMMTILKNVRRYKRMKRKELEKLPILQATTAMLKQAENEPMIESGYFRKELRYEHKYYARCKRFDRILKVAIYLTKNLAAGGRKPVYELFLDYDAQDFLTYSFMEKKWRTAMLRNLPQQGFGIYDAQISSRDSAVIGQYLHSKWEAIGSIRKGFGKSSFWPGTRKKPIRGMQQWRLCLRFQRTGTDGSVRSALSRIICSINTGAAAPKPAIAATVTARFRFGSRSTMRLPDASDAEERCSSNPSARWAGCAQGEISCI